MVQEPYGFKAVLEGRKNYKNITNGSNTVMEKFYLDILDGECNETLVLKPRVFDIFPTSDTASYIINFPPRETEMIQMRERVQHLYRHQLHSYQLFPALRLFWNMEWLIDEEIFPVPSVTCMNRVTDQSFSGDKR